tara:strand:- start:995 stop:1405 length:411 start_codon:yes stop_codon:yes gene_type:complete
MIQYQKILNLNLINVFKDILRNIKENGISNKNQLYITFLTDHKNVKIPNWLIKKYPKEITIIIQFEFYDLKIYEDFFKIVLSFDDIKTDLKIGYDSIISFADPIANFGLRFQTDNLQNNQKEQKNNVINFLNYKKN